MNKDTKITDVIFRVDTTKDFKGTIFALFPHEVCNTAGHVTTYQHVGQHSGGNYNNCIRRSRPATENEYKELKLEMESLGYNFKLVTRQNYNKFLISFKNR